MAAPERPALPAWLESLRPGERAVPSPNEQQNFFSPDLIDKDALPGWMRPESAEGSHSDQYPALRPALLPTSNTDRGHSLITASSLIDEQSLPSWIQENSLGQEDSLGAHYSTERNISAASLVQPGAMPEWMKNAEHYPVTPPSIPAAPASQYASPDIPLQGMAANSLIDPQVLPTWMSTHDELSASTATTGQSGLAAGSLLDMNALPDWLRENKQEQHIRAEVVLPVQAWQAPAMHGEQSASSLIDVDTLPEWLRAATDPAQREEPPATPPADGPAIPPHVEAIRSIPSRPRSRKGSCEESEAAANIFASMLSVTSPPAYFASQSPSNVTSFPSPQEQSQQVMPQVESALPPARGQVGQSNRVMPQMDSVILVPQPVVTGPASSYPPGRGEYQQPMSPQQAPGTLLQQPMSPQQAPGMLPQQSANPSVLPIGAQMLSDSSPSTPKSTKRGILEIVRRILGIVRDWFSRKLQKGHRR